MTRMSKLLATSAVIAFGLSLASCAPTLGSARTGQTSGPQSREAIAQPVRPVPKPHNYAERKQSRDQHPRANGPAVSKSFKTANNNSGKTQTAPPDPSAINPKTGKTYGEKHWAVANVTGAAEHEIARAVGKKDTITIDEFRKALPLRKVGKPKATLAAAKIDDKSGDSVGQVHKVALNRHGSPRVLQVDVGGFLGLGERVVAINARHFRYLPKRDLLIVDMTQNELNKLPAVDQQKVADEKTTEDGRPPLSPGETHLGP